MEPVLANAGGDSIDLLHRLVRFFGWHVAHLSRARQAVASLTCDMPDRNTAALI
jgi:hypothetical protein